jgi:cytochrome c553
MKMPLIKTLAAAFALLGLAVANTAMAQAAPNAAAGEKKAAMCIGCHGIPGYQASFPEVYKVPMISGQSAAYIVLALEAYKKGDRKHPTMRGLAGSLTEQDMKDLGAFYAQHGAGSNKAPKAAAVAATPEVQALVQKCTECHGTDFNTRPEGKEATPKLAGQHADYLLVALKSYQITNNAKVGRSNGTMADQIKGLKPADLKLIAKHLSQQPGDLQVVSQPRFR